MIRLATFILIITTTFSLIYLGLYEDRGSDSKKVFTTNEMAWYGMDFTKASFIGTFDTGMGVNPADGIELRNKWIPAWNNLIVAEQQNFNLKRPFRKCCVFYDITSVNQLNKTIDPEALLVSRETKISKATIKEMVKRYTPIEKKDGIGLVFIVESFNKNDKTANLYVTFFDIETKEILVSEFMSGRPIGFGLRNYWAGAIKEILVWIDLYEYNKWKNKYYNNAYEDETKDVLLGAEETAKLKTESF